MAHKTEQPFPGQMNIGDAISDFALKLFHVLSIDNGDGNTFLSPYCGSHADYVRMQWGIGV